MLATDGFNERQAEERGGRVVAAVAAILTLLIMLLVLIGWIME